MATLEEIQERRAELRAKLKEDTDARKAIDAEAILAIEESLGVSRIDVVELPFTSPDLPVLCAVRAPDAIEMKRFRDTVKQRKNGEPGDSVLGHQQLTAACLVYPDKDTYKELLKVHTGIDVQFGMRAAALSIGREEDHSKE